MSFSYEYSGTTVDQGTLASSYTNALSSYLQGDGADYVAFLSHAVNNLSVEVASALKNAVMAGEFTLSGLFSAAQSKTGEVEGDAITNPTPTLTVTVGGTEYTIDLTAMLTGTDTASWNTVTKKDTITHTREFFTGSKAPEDYSDDWANPQPNQAPTATPIELTLAEFDEHAAAEAEEEDYSEEDVKYDINLLDTATDPDDDPLSVVDGSVKIVTVVDDVVTYGDLPAYITVDYDTGTLTVDRNHESFDELYLGSSWDLKITYQISDGTNTIDNTVDLTITGTADQFSDSTSITVTKVAGTLVYSGDYELTGFDWDAVVDVTGHGDYSHPSEGFEVTEDVGSIYQGTMTGKDNLETFNDVDPDETFTDGWSDDDSFDYTVEFKEQAANGSSVTITLEYDYWM
ncbi:MAG: SRPBCC family protein [Rhodocyclaceae bacterium]|nr:SRPBCC family protein [Rhodocyclaceae bacterium]